MFLKISAMVAVATLLAACGAGSGQEPGASSTSSSEPSTATSSDSSERGITTVVPSEQGTPESNHRPEDLVEEVRALASEETGIPAADFVVETAAQVTWSDGSLGCPQPGQAYTQALVDGYWVVLSHEGETYDYRSTLDGDFSRCSDGLAPTSVYEDK